MSRWEHEVRVIAVGGRGEVRLVCRCGWQSRVFDEPAVSRLAEFAQDHRRELA